MSEMEKAYEPHKYEPEIYQKWEDSGAFKPSEDKSKETFTILMPPPNANADLHIGHTLSTALQDLMIRYARMQGKAALFLPGADHAGFETQVMFERHLEKEGKSRFDYTREELYQQIWDFVQSNKGRMEDQQRRIGASVDWSRNTFTLDPHVVRTAHETFEKLWDDDLVYRGKRIVNYCTFHGTAFSDLEVEHKEVNGHLWHIRYPIEGSNDHIVIATTRPETMLGDTAVAVHPDDERYSSMIGKLITLPITGRSIPVVADDGVNIEFGTGAVKVTPAHDPLDFEIAERHNLPQIEVINKKGEMSENTPESYRGLSFGDARKKVLQELEEGSFLVKTEDYTHSVGHCYKCGNVIQPLVMDQWLIRVKPLAQRAIQALEQNQIEIYPSSKKGVLIQWYENLRDWNVSRQIVWGIPIPAFISDDGDAIINIDAKGDKIEKDGKPYFRDPDTFDTWFSSGQWPEVTLKYPDSEDFKRFYPTSVMETGADILFWWVSRMIMLGLYLTDEVPFKTVYLHGLITVGKQKMSKSKGNSLAPTPLHEKYGADALRMGLIANRSAGQNQSFSEKRVETYRNFSNKLWNVSRYSLGNISAYDGRFEIKSSADAWIIDTLNYKNKQITAALDSYRFSEAQEVLYSLVWDDFADWYIEASKYSSNPGVLAHSLETILKLAHPFAPFVTEAIWQYLPWQSQNLITEEWPTAEKVASSELKFDRIMALVSQIRNISAELSLQKPKVYITSGIAKNEWDVCRGLAKAGEIKDGSPESGIRIQSTSIEAWIEAEEGTVKRYKELIHKRFDEANAYLLRLNKQLENKSYVDSAPPELVEETRNRQADTKLLVSQLDEQLKSIKQ